MALILILLVTIAPPPTVMEGSGAAELTIRVFPAGPAHKTQARTWTLSCDPARGTLPDRASACRRLLAIKQPFRPTPRDAACTQIYGGPAVAYVKGTFRGAPVARSFNRKNGCEIERWQRVRFLLRH
jgi:hypothetical protein